MPQVVVGARHLRGGLGCGAAAQLVSVLAREVQQLPPAELLDLLDRRRHDERLLGLLGSAAVLVLEDAECCSPGIRPALIQVIVQDAKRLWDNLIERGAAGSSTVGLRGRPPRRPDRIRASCSSAGTVPLSDFGHRAEGEDTPPRREETATADDDLVGVVGVPQVADVIQPAEVRAVACEHSVAPGDGEAPAEFRLCPVAPLASATLLHGREE